jgi:hypothetical protein
MLLVTLHGGKPKTHASLNNIHVYDKNGKLVTRSLLDETPGIVLDELRAIRLQGNLLYLVNANKSQNSILCYKRHGKRYSYVSTFASQANCPGILHPFDLTFDNAGFCYVSSQDTNVVTRLEVSKDGRTGTPADLAPALPKSGKFLPGTFVASSVGNLSNPATTAVAAPAGLQFSGTGAKKHSVRGVLWIKGALYVVDQPAGRVKVYDADGKLVGQSNQVDQIVHLNRHKGKLFVTGGNEVLMARIPKKPGDFLLAPLPGLSVKNGCGLAFTGSQRFYLASRTRNVIFKFDKSLTPLKFGSTLPDNPEFLVHVKPKDWK